ncbi:MAG: tRNA (adenosine(37)-N6)-threonylcarbamoyltransferase complex ATPase subunit type 1 TsaE [Verrucomicrobiota bacterium]
MDQLSQELFSQSPQETRDHAINIAKGMPLGGVVQLKGDLGSGKTEWVKGFAQGMGSGELVTSPSFALLNEYPGGRLPIYHWDLYRLSEGVDWSVLDLPEQLPSCDGVTLVEWPERYLGYWPAETLVVEIERVSEESRKIFVRM